LGRREPNNFKFPSKFGGELGREFAKKRELFLLEGRGFKREGWEGLNFLKVSRNYLLPNWLWDFIHRGPRNFGIRKGRLKPSET